MNVELRIPDVLVEVIADAVAARLAGDALGRPHESRWRLLAVDEVAELLGRSPRWVHDAVTRRGLPHVHLDGGGGRMFDPADVRAWARARRIPAVDA